MSARITKEENENFGKQIKTPGGNVGVRNGNTVTEQVYNGAVPGHEVEIPVCNRKLETKSLV
jgi:hypothetical protein